jgi:hypothetical protein
MRRARLGGAAEPAKLLGSTPDFSIPRPRSLPVRCASGVSAPDRRRAAPSLKGRSNAIRCSDVRAVMVRLLESAVPEAAVRLLALLGP